VFLAPAGFFFTNVNELQGLAGCQARNTPNPPLN